MLSSRAPPSSFFDKQSHESTPETGGPTSLPLTYVDHLFSRYFLVTLTAQTLTVFLNIVLAKRYTNPSSEVIALLAGLDQVDTCFLHFVDAIESVIRLGSSGTLRHERREEPN